MARLRLELRDIAGLVREIVNRRQPLVVESFTFGKWPFKSQFDVTWHSLDEVSVDGPIVLESELDAVQRTLRFDALAPNLIVSGPCTVIGGGVLVKDGTRPLVVSLDGAAQVEVRFASRDSNTDSQAVHVAAKTLPITRRGSQCCPRSRTACRITWPTVWCSRF